MFHLVPSRLSFVVVASIVVTGFSVQSSATSNTISRALTSTSLVTIVEQQLVVTLGQADLSAIKLTAGLAKTALNAYYSVLFRSGADIAGNALTTVPAISVSDDDVDLLVLT